VSDSAPLLLSVFPTFDPGGAQTRFINLANHFGKALRHVVTAMDGKYGCADRLSARLDVEFYQVTLQKGRTITNRRAARHVLKELRPDILVTHNWGTIEWALANLPRIVHHIHIEDGFGPDESDRQFFRRVWGRRLSLHHTILVVPSQNLYRIARNIWRFPERRVRFIPNGIDCSRFDRGIDATGRARGSGDALVVGTVAALRPEKNLARLLRAFAMLGERTECRLVIVGEGPERSRLDCLAAELRLQDRSLFVGHVPDPERLYAEFDIFVLSSDTEQMPYTVLEAMAAGCAVVATDVGDISDMVAPPNRPFIVARDDEAIAAGLRHLIADNGLRQRIGEANKRRALAEFDQRRMFEAFTQLYGLTPV
jgi:glycosyltransferase involved in cell wall biosynthesis